MIVHKFYSDFFYANKYYALIGGLSLQETNKLEIYFLKTINFEINISETEYSSYETSLNKYFINGNNQDI